MRTLFDWDWEKINNPFDLLLDPPGFRFDPVEYTAWNASKFVTEAQTREFIELLAMEDDPNSAYHKDRLRLP